jgi:hypothetical protein
MVDTKATTEAKKEHEAKKSALGTLLNTFDGVRELHGCMVILHYQQTRRFRSSSRGRGRIELMHFGRLNAIDIMDYYIWSYYARSRKRCTRLQGIISCRSIVSPERTSTRVTCLLIWMVDVLESTEGNHVARVGAMRRGSISDDREGSRDPATKHAPMLSL